MLGGALFAECRTLKGLLQSPQYLSADAEGRFFRSHRLHRECLFRVELCVVVTELITALWNCTQTSPRSVGNVEHLPYQRLRFRIALLFNSATVLILHL